MNKQWFRTLFRRRMLIILLLIIQAGVLLYLITSGSRLSHIISKLLTVLSALIALHIIAKKDKGAYKTNLDFRSLYFHFECGVLMFDNTVVHEIKENFLQTLEICQPVTEKDCRANFLTRLFQDILRLFASIM